MRYSGAYSYSSLSKFDECPQEFAFLKVDRLGEIAGAPALVGRAEHRVLERYGRHCIEHARIDDPDALHTIISEVRAEVPTTSIADFDGIAERFGEFNFDPSVMRGAQFELQLAWRRGWEPCGWWDDAVRYRMIVDVFHIENGVGIVTDWKTNRVIPSQSEFESSFQTKSYAWALSELHPEIPQWIVRGAFVRYGPRAIRQATYTRDELADVRTLLDGKMARVDAETKFPGTPGKHCAVCSYADRCPAFQKLYGATFPSLKDPAVAANAARALVVAKRRAKDLEERLRSYCSEFGEVSVDGKLLGFSLRAGVAFHDAKQVGEALKEARVPSDAIWAALNATKTSITKALRAAGLKGKALDAELDAIAGKVGAPTHETRFEWKNDEEDAA